MFKNRAYRLHKRQALWILSLLQQRNCIADIFFKCFATIFIDLGFVLFSVGEASCTADTTTDTSHTLNKVAVKNTLIQLEKCHTAGFNTVTYTVNSDKSVCAFTFLADTEFEQYQALERATATPFERVNFLQNEVLNEFRLGNTDSIPEFRTNFYKDMAEEVSPNSFHDLIQIAGLSHGTGVWINNAEELVNQGIPVRNVIAYRDDVFNHIAQHMLRKGIANTGYAYKIMEDTRRGVYARGGVSEEMKKQLKDIGIEDWFIDSIEKIQYLFPKAHGVTYVKLAATLMWYKIHYPKEFAEIML